MFSENKDLERIMFRMAERFDSFYHRLYCLKLEKGMEAELRGPTACTPKSGSDSDMLNEILLFQNKILTTIAEIRTLQSNDSAKSYNLTASDIYLAVPQLEWIE